MDPLPIDDASPPAVRGQPPGVRLDDGTKRRIAEMYIEGAMTIADIARRTGAPHSKVRRVVVSVCREIGKDADDGERYAARWARARRMRLNGLGVRMARAQEELRVARDRRDAAIRSDDSDILDPRINIWTETIGRIEDRLRKILLEYTDTMGAVPPLEMLRAEVAADLQRERDAQRFLIGGRDGGQENAEHAAGPGAVHEGGEERHERGRGGVFAPGREGAGGAAA